MSQHADDRRDELLAQHVVDGLSPTEREEIEALLGPGAAAELEQWELTAGAVSGSRSDTDEALPAELRARLEQQGLAELRGRAAAPAPTSTTTHTAPVFAGPGSSGSGTAWLVAAAAALLAVIAWWPAAEAVEPSARERYDALVVAAGDLQRADWAALEDPRLAGIGGEVVWSNARQEGYMRLTGVPVNDPAEAQYQLWIVDPARDAEPIDGGVFDVSADGEVIVPIDAKLAVLEPSVFAITLEQPGGVVVSEGPLLAAASLQG